MNDNGFDGKTTNINQTQKEEANKKVFILLAFSDIAIIVWLPL